METVVTSKEKKVAIGDGHPVVLIGERINPTGKKKLAKALQAGDLSVVRKEAAGQVAAGADILDVNVGASGVDETALLPEAVGAIMEVADVPLCIDSNNPKAIENALQVYEGKALINSVSGEEASLKEILPIARYFNAAVIGLTIDDDGIPADAGRRFEIAQNIVRRAEDAGIDRSDVIIDCLAMTLSTDSGAVLTTLAAMRRIKEELGVNLTLGASNVSFGLPDRRLINEAFFSMAVFCGLNCPIVDAAQIRKTALAADLCMGNDSYAMRYIRAYRERG